MNKKIYNYKGVRVNSFGIPVFNSKTNTINNNQKKKDVYHSSFSFSFKKDSPKNLIVMYDIPEEKKKERDWFRRHLRKFDYIMIQRSVWVGPSPLPKDFIKYVKSIGLKDKLKVFKLKNKYSETSNDI